MSRLVLVGAGGHGRVVADTARCVGWDEIVFLDDSFPERSNNGEWSVIGPSKADIDGPRFVSVGDNLLRNRLWRELLLAECPIIEHPSAIVSHASTLGAGVFVAAGSVVQTGTVVGVGAILNTSCSVDHDCLVGCFAHISPGAHLAGGVSVGDRTWIGIGAVVREGVRIGADVKVGAGAVVIEDIADGLSVGGVPARSL